MDKNKKKKEAKKLVSLIGDWIASLTFSLYTLFGVTLCLVEVFARMEEGDHKKAIMSLVIAFLMIVISRGGILTNDMNPDSVEQSVVIFLFPTFGLYSSSFLLDTIPNTVAFLTPILWLGVLGSAWGIGTLAKTKLASHRSGPVMISYIAALLLAISILLK